MSAGRGHASRVIFEHARKAAQGGREQGRRKAASTDRLPVGKRDRGQPTKTDRSRPSTLRSAGADRSSDREAGNRTTSDRDQRNQLQLLRDALLDRGTGPRAAQRKDSARDLARIWDGAARRTQDRDDRGTLRRGQRLLTLLQELERGMKAAGVDRVPAFPDGHDRDRLEREPERDRRDTCPGEPDHLEAERNPSDELTPDRDHARGGRRRKPSSTEPSESGPTSRRDAPSPRRARPRDGSSPEPKPGPDAPRRRTDGRGSKPDDASEPDAPRHRTDGRDARPDDASKPDAPRRDTDDKTPKDGAGKWGRLRPDEGDYALAAVLRGGSHVAELLGAPNAARHMRHYLGNTGKPLEVSVDAMLRDMPSLARVLEQAKADARRRAEQVIGKSGGKDALSFSIMGRRDTHYCNKKESKDWYYAIGGHTQWYTANVRYVPDASRSGSGQVQLELRLHVFDRYNFDQSKGVLIGGVIPVPDAIPGRLHAVGLAREFVIRGKSSDHALQWRHAASH